jgi:hypothetical protein
MGIYFKMKNILKEIDSLITIESCCDDFGSALTEKVNGIMYYVDSNSCIISEAVFYKMLDRIKTNKNIFAVMSAYRKYTEDNNGNRYLTPKSEKIKANRKLRSYFNNLKMGVYQLVGHWRECKDDKIVYKDCPKDMLVDAIERSYLIVKPNDVDEKQFFNLIMTFGKAVKQDAVIYGELNNGVKLYDPKSKSAMTDLGKNVTIGKIAQGYSEWILGDRTIPFVFEGMEIAENNFAKQAFTMLGINYK